MYAFRRALVLLFFSAIFPAEQSMAMFMQPTAAPVERLLVNIQSYIDKHPDDANAYYQLARANYLSFVNRSHKVPVAGEHEGLPKVAPQHLEGNWLDNALRAEAMRRSLEQAQIEDVGSLEDEAQPAFYEALYRLEDQMRKDGWKPPQLEPEDALQRAEASLLAFDQAIRLEPKNGLYHLGRASLLEQAESFHARHPDADLPEQLATVQRDESAICDAYLRV